MIPSGIPKSLRCSEFGLKFKEDSSTGWDFFDNLPCVAAMWLVNMSFIAFSRMFASWLLLSLSDTKVCGDRQLDVISFSSVIAQVWSDSSVSKSPRVAVEEVKLIPVNDDSNDESSSELVTLTILFLLLGADNIVNSLARLTLLSTWKKIIGTTVIKLEINWGDWLTAGRCVTGYFKSGLVSNA